MPQKVTGKITEAAAVDCMVTDITVEALADAPRDQNVSIRCGDHATCCIFPQDHGQAEMTFLARLGDRGMLELMLVGDDIQAFLGLRVGMPVVVKW